VIAADAELGFAREHAVAFETVEVFDSDGQINGAEANAAIGPPRKTTVFRP